MRFKPSGHIDLCIIFALRGATVPLGLWLDNLDLGLLFVMETKATRS